MKLAGVNSYEASREDIGATSNPSLLMKLARIRSLLRLLRCCFWKESFSLLCLLCVIFCLAGLWMEKGVVLVVQKRHKHSTGKLYARIRCEVRVGDEFLQNSGRSVMHGCLMRSWVVRQGWIWFTKVDSSNLFVKNNKGIIDEEKVYKRTTQDESLRYYRKLVIILLTLFGKIYTCMK